MRLKIVTAMIDHAAVLALPRKCGKNGMGTTVVDIGISGIVVAAVVAMVVLELKQIACLVAVE